jgi:hypothetical protein
MAQSRCREESSRLEYGLDHGRPASVLVRAPGRGRRPDGSDQIEPVAGDSVMVTWRDGGGEEQAYTFASAADRTACPVTHTLPRHYPTCAPRTHLARHTVQGCGAVPRRSPVFFLLKLLFLPIWLPLKLIRELIEHAGRRRRHYGAGQRRYGGGRMAVVLAVVAIAIIGGIAAALGAGSNGSGKRPASASSPPAAVSASASTTAAAAVSASASTTATAPVSANAAAAAGGTHSSAPVPAANPQPATGPGGCHPFSDERTCYEPGEFCRTSDHGVTGLAGDGETITCKNNDGWRWEPASAAGANNPPPPQSPPTASATPTRSPSPTTPPTPTPTSSPLPQPQRA